MKYFSKHYILLSFVLILQNAKGSSLNERVDPLVDTKVGLIRGLFATDGDYSMFKGIPYATIDKNRPFASATRYPPFEGIFEAYDGSAQCPQASNEFGPPGPPKGSLDCLHLNVFVPSSATSKKLLPVMVWIHGGAFQTGASSSAGPSFLLKHDIILVTINYRVGTYGFLCTDDPAAPGNQGLKDQRLAFRWIKENIEAFGGDINQMTLAGLSAGSKSVDYHLHLTTEIPFRGYILESGTVLLPHLEQERDSSAPIKMAEYLGFSTNNVSEALSFLADSDVADVVEAGLQIPRREPCYEKEFENEESFVTDYSINLDTTNIRSKNVLLGFTTQEWKVSYMFMTEEDYATWDGFREELDHYFNFEKDELNAMTNNMRHFYIGDEKVGKESESGLVAFHSDFLFNYPCERSIDKYLASGVGKVFYYMFTYVGDTKNPEDGGTVHGEESLYLFDSRWVGKPSERDQLTIDRMTTMWTNFVRYGDPTPATSELLPAKWEAITDKDSPYYYMDIGSELVLKKRPYNDRMAYWKLFYKRNEKKQRGYKEH